VCVRGVYVSTSTSWLQPKCHNFITFTSVTLGLKQLGHKADHPSPSGAKVKSAWSYMSTPQ